MGGILPTRREVRKPPAAKNMWLGGSPKRKTARPGPASSPGPTPGAQEGRELLHAQAIPGAPRGIRLVKRVSSHERASALLSVRIALRPRRRYDGPMSTPDHPFDDKPTA